MNFVELSKRPANFRKERGNCRICWYATDIFDFMVSDNINKGNVNSGCCGYGIAGIIDSGFDCVMIQSGSAGMGAAVSGKILGANEFCGRRLASIQQADTNNKTICCKR